MDFAEVKKKKAKRKKQFDYEAQITATVSRRQVIEAIANAMPLLGSFSVPNQANFIGIVLTELHLELR